MEIIGAAVEPTAALRFTCPSCGRKYATKPGMAGKKIRCKGCGEGVRVPAGDADSVLGPSRPAMKADGGTIDATSPPPAGDRPTVAAARPGAVDGAGGSSSLLDELASLEGVRRPRRVEAVLPSRAEVMEQVRQKVAEQEAVETQKKAEKAKKKKKKKGSGYFDPKDTLALVGGVAAFVAVLAFLAWGYPDLRFPLGGLLCVVGFIVYLLGAASLRQLVAEEGPLQAILFRFFPPYQWWFVATHWSEAKDFVAFFAAGLVILAIGGSVIKTSAIGKKAEESERAYQEVRRGGQAELPPVLSDGAADVGN
jgi:hypothetical protein